MNTSDEKTRRLADWHILLEGILISDSLDAWYRKLRLEVALMKTGGLIDGDEMRELCELADAAYSHHLDDNITRELNEWCDKHGKASHWELMPASLRLLIAEKLKGPESLAMSHPSV